jgi:hypothetical protein
MDRLTSYDLSEGISFPNPAHLGARERQDMERIAATMTDRRGALRGMFAMAVLLKSTASAHSLMSDADDHAREHEKLQKETWEQVKAKYEKLTLLETQPPEAVFGNAYEAAFIPPEKLETGEVPDCVECIDERVNAKGRNKIAIAGSGVLMSRIPDKQELTGTDADLLIPNDEYRELVHNLRGLMAKGHTIEVSSHEGCGAAKMYCDEFEKRTGKRPDAKKVEIMAAERLSKDLGLKERPKRADYEKGDIRMNGKPQIHHAYAVVLDGTDRVNLQTLGVDALQISAPLEPAKYTPKEAEAAGKILLGDHGIGPKYLPEVLFVAIGDPDNPRFSAEALAKRTDGILKGIKTRTLRVTAPSAKKR